MPYLDRRGTVKSGLPALALPRSGSTVEDYGVFLSVRWYRTPVCPYVTSDNLYSRKYPCDLCCVGRERESGAWGRSETV